MSSSKLQKRQERRAQRRRKTMFNGFVILLVVVAAAYLVWAQSQPAEALAEPEMLASGQAVYTQYCASCHGDQGQGHVALAEAPALNETEHAWHHPDGQLQALVSTGGTLMPAFGDQLDDTEIKAVIRYIQTWWLSAQLDSQQNASQSYPFE